MAAANCTSKAAVSRAIAFPRAIPLGELTLPRTFLVIQRAGSEWTPASKILHVFDVETQAEDMAAKLKTQYPHQTFGVALIVSEAHPRRNPVEIVRLRDR